MGVGFEHFSIRIFILKVAFVRKLIAGDDKLAVGRNVLKILLSYKSSQVVQWQRDNNNNSL